MTHYHHIPGRMRVRIEAIKRNPRCAVPLKAALEKLPGVEAVEIRPLTGSVLVRYDSAECSGAALLDFLRQQGYTTPHPVRPPAQTSRAVQSPELHQEVTKAVLGFAAQALFEKSLIALAAAIL